MGGRTALRRSGLILAGNNPDWFVSGAPDERWDEDLVAELQSVSGSAFAAADVSGLIDDPGSAQAAG